MNLIAAFLCATLALNSVAPAAAQARGTISSDLKISQAAHHVRGVDLAKGLSLTCSAKNFKDFSAWSMRNGFYAKENAAEIEFSFTKTGVSAAHPKMELTAVAQNRISAKVDGRTFTAEDGCDLFLKALAPVKHASLLLPEAQAFSELEDKAKDRQELAMASASMAMGIVMTIAFPPAGLYSLAFGIMGVAGCAWNAYQGLQASQSLYTKDLFEQFLHAKDLTLQCDESTMILNTGTQKVVVRKSGPTVDFLDAKSEKTLLTNSDSLLAEKSRAAILSLAKVCNSKTDAETWTATLKTARTDVQDRIAKVAKEAEVPSTAAPGTAAAPAPAVN